MSKALTIGGMVVAILLLILFSLDLAIKIPFKRAGLIMDIAFIVCAIILGYLSWSTFKESE